MMIGNETLSLEKVLLSVLHSSGEFNGRPNSNDSLQSVNTKTYPETLKFSEKQTIVS